MRAAGTVTGILVLGTFMIPGSYVPKADGARGNASTSPSARNAGAPTETGSASVGGRVYGPGGAPLADATVSLAGSGFWPPRTVVSDAAGRFGWNRVPAGVYELRASRGRLASPALGGILVEPGARRVFGLRLAEGWTLVGQIKDTQTGRGVADADIHMATGLLGVYAREARSDASGRFEIPGVVGSDASVYVEAPDYVSTGPLPVFSEHPSLEVKLERAARLGGIVVDDRGGPVEGASVRALGDASYQLGGVAEVGSLGVTSGPVPPISASGVRQLALADAVSTDRSGAFELAHLRAGAYTALVTHDGYAPGESSEVRVAPGEAIEDLRIVLFRGGEIRGRVLDTSGRGLTGIPVELRVPTERLPRMTVSRDDGAFAFRGVRGPAEVAALPYDLQPASRSLSVEPQQRVDVDLVLTGELLTLRGRTVDERGVGVEDALVTIIATRAGTRIRRSTKSGQDGTFAVPALPAPPYTLEVEHAAYGPATREILGGDVDLRVVLSSGVTVTGQVIDDWTFSGLEGAMVSLDGTSSFSVTTGGDGRFSFRRVPIDTYEMRVSHPDFETQSQRIEIEPPLYVDRSRELPAIRLVRGGTIEGEVLDAYGAPVPGAEVTWRSDDDWKDPTTTDRRGRFVLRGVPEGVFWLRARHPEAGEAYASRPTRVRPAETTPGAYVRLPAALDIEE